MSHSESPRASVTRKAADRVAAGHPWIFSSDVASTAAAQPGDVVEVADPKGRLLGIGHYSSTSQIAIRLLATQPETVDAAFWRRRLEAAIAFRRRIAPENADNNAARLVHAEADQMPACIVDRYGDSLVLQTLNQGMDRALPLITEALVDLLQPAGILARNDAAVRKQENLPLESKVVHGAIPEHPIEVRLNGLTLLADLKRGQKTGIYLDQRENYMASARHVPDGARVLDCFTSTGGFALHCAAFSKTAHIEAVDSSAHALDTARANARRNQLESRIEFREADVFDLLAGHDAARRRFQAVILDPPPFAKSRSALSTAARGYLEINRRALRLLEPGGILVTCSCSHHFSEAHLFNAVAQAALQSGRTLRVLERRTQAADHPILLTVPETLYLKCLILEVL